MDTNRQHGTWFKDFHTYYQTNNILKLLLLSTISQTYTDAVKDDDTGYGLATTLTILPHLWDIYGEISDMDIEYNLTTMSTSWSSSTPIEDVFRQLHIA